MGAKYAGVSGGMTYGQFWRINAVIIAVLVAVVSLTPDTDALASTISFTAWLAKFLLGDPTSSDKIAHFLAYGALGFFTTLGFAPRKSRLLTVAAGIIVYGASLEVLQAMGGHRTGDIYDLLANSLGATCGIIGALICRVLIEQFSINFPWLKREHR